MANETTTTTANDITYSAVIAPAFLATLAEHSLPMTWCNEYDITGQPSNAIDIPRAASDYGSADDDGAGVDTEYDATQGTALSNVAWDTDKVTATAAEYGIQYEITDNVVEDSIQGIDVFNIIFVHMARALALAWTDDFCALFASLSNSVGTTTNDLTVANMLSAQSGIRRRGVLAEDGLVYVLDGQQGDDLEGALIATSTSQAVFASAADRILGVMASANNGMAADRQIMTFRGYPVHTTGLTDTANAGADVVGACFTPAGPRNGPFATYGNAIKRAFRLETDRVIGKRTTLLVGTMRMGVAEITDGSGTKIVTDA